MASSIFAIITLGAVIMATFVPDTRRAVLALWVAGLSLGALFLTLGAELLAIVEWIMSTLVAISFIFFSLMFGEYGKTPTHRETLKPVTLIICLMAGGAFAFIIWLGGQGLTEAAPGMPGQASDILSLGKTLAQQHLVALEILALTLFTALVGGGVIARPQRERDIE